MSNTKLKTRELLTSRQRSILVSFYNQNPYPSSSERHQLVQLTSRTPKQIQDWFANRRRNDPKLVPPKPTSTTPPIAMNTNYYYESPPPPPPLPTMCSSCGLPQPFPPMDPSFYFPYDPTMTSYPFPTNFQS